MLRLFSILNPPPYCHVPGPADPDALASPARPPAGAPSAGSNRSARPALPAAAGTAGAAAERPASMNTQDACGAEVPIH